MNDNIEYVFKALDGKKYLPFENDNVLLKKYLDSKRSGCYETIDYGLDANGCCNKTLLKDAILIKQGINDFNKSFTSLTRDDVVKFRNNLKDNIIKATKWKKEKRQKNQAKEIKCRLIQYTPNLSFRSKNSRIGALKQFWQWYRAYCYKEEKREIANIFDRIKLKSPKITEYKIDWLNSDQIKKLMHILENHEDYKLFAAIAIDTCGRPIELANLRRCHFIYEKEKLHCQLPSIKGCSGRKHLNEVLFEKAFIERKIKDMQPEQFLFDFIDPQKPFNDSPGCFDWNQERYESIKARTRHYTERVTGKGYYPYVYRKTATMYWLSVSENNIPWVQKRLGHVEGSIQIRHYMTFQGIKSPEGIMEKIKSDKYENVSETMLAYQDELTSNKIQMQQMQQQMQSMQQQFLNMVASIPQINAVDHREIIKQTIETIQGMKKNKPDMPINNASI